jgi:hypothetical protein
MPKYSVSTDEDEDDEHSITGDVKPENIHTTTIGIKHIEYKKMSKLLQNLYKMCTFCIHYYKSDFIINDADLGVVCKHCLFCLNYNETERLEFDLACSEKGFGIAEYVLECSDEHDSKTCMNDMTCFLCDYKKKIPIVNILNYDVLQYGNFDTDKKNDENVEHNPSTIKLYEELIFNKKEKIKIPKQLTI